MWLNEASFRLPGWVENVFPSEPPDQLMRQSHQAGKTTRRQDNGKFSVAVPLRHEDTGLGVIQICRDNGGKFTRRELNFIEGLAKTSCIALLAWHRISVERWRIGQLGLVRTVSAQIANELDIDELAHRVTRLIQSTFKYYYVGIFTRRPGQNRLEYRSGSGGATRRRGV